MNDYILKHDFGYGNHDEEKEINKLTLRNMEDVDCYINQLLKTLFIAEVNKQVVKFVPENIKTKVVIKKVSM